MKAVSLFVVMMMVGCFTDPQPCDPGEVRLCSCSVGTGAQTCSTIGWGVCKGCVSPIQDGGTPINRT
jgi:hypothetical protein